MEIYLDMIIKLLYSLKAINRQSKEIQKLGSKNLQLVLILSESVSGSKKVSGNVWTQIVFNFIVKMFISSNCFMLQEISFHKLNEYQTNYLIQPFIYFMFQLVLVYVRDTRNTLELYIWGYQECPGDKCLRIISFRPWFIDRPTNSFPSHRQHKQELPEITALICIW